MALAADPFSAVNVVDIRSVSNKKRMKCRQGARKVNSNAESDQYKNAYDLLFRIVSIHLTGRPWPSRI